MLNSSSILLLAILICAGCDEPRSTGNFTPEGAPPNGPALTTKNGGSPSGSAPQAHGPQKNSPFASAESTSNFVDTFSDDSDMVTKDDKPKPKEIFKADEAVALKRALGNVASCLKNEDVVSPELAVAVSVIPSGRVQSVSVAGVKGASQQCLSDRLEKANFRALAERGQLKGKFKLDYRPGKVEETVVETTELRWR